MAQTTMTDAICLVTGASSGIGREIARGLAWRGARVLAVSRAEGAGARVAAEIRRETGNESVRFLPADLSRMREVRRLAAEVRAAVPRLDVLVNNAGILSPERRVTEEGLELTFALDHLAYHLLAAELRPLLEEGARARGEARVVQTSSAAARWGRIDWDDPQLREGYSGWRAYNQAKLANLLHTFELARRLEGTGVTSNAFHPGFVATAFGAGDEGLRGRALAALQRLVGRSPVAGAATGLHLACHPDVRGVSGRYFVDGAAVPAPPRALDREAQRRLWELSERLAAVAAERAEAAA